jgi:hypothetical protein
MIKNDTTETVDNALERGNKRNIFVQENKTIVYFLAQLFII